MDSQFFKMRTESREKRAPILGGVVALGAMGASSLVLLLERSNEDERVPMLMEDWSSSKPDSWL